MINFIFIVSLFSQGLFIDDFYPYYEKENLCKVKINSYELKKQSINFNFYDLEGEFYSLNHNVNQDTLFINVLFYIDRPLYKKVFIKKDKLEKPICAFDLDGRILDFTKYIKKCFC